MFEAEEGRKGDATVEKGGLLPGQDDREDQEPV